MGINTSTYNNSSNHNRNCSTNLNGMGQYGNPV